MRLMREGKTPPEIRAYIDAEYSKYGPPTDTGPIESGPEASCTSNTVAACGETAPGESSANDGLAETAGP